MAEFSIGDRVRCILDYGEGATYGDTGTVIGDDGYCTIYIEWDEFRACRHDCCGRCKPHHGWNVPDTNIERIYDVLDLGELPMSDLSLIL